METKALYAVIMAGGRGERFWPASRFASPKQFVSLFGGKPLITIAVERLSGLVPAENILIVTSADLVAQSIEALPMLPAANVIGEPFGRDTAAACALGTALVEARGGESAVVAVLTADHLIEDVPVFRRTLRDGAALVAESDAIGVIGIVPECAATGYGYIESAGDLPNDSETAFMRVARFVEKPDAATAAEYLASGKHFWNSGMFLWRVSTFKNALAAFAPKIAAMYNTMLTVCGHENFDATLLDEYNRLEKISVDYAIMEKAAHIVAARGAFGWDDVGSWNSAAAHFAEDEHGNRVVGRCSTLNASGNALVNCVDDHLVAVSGVKDVIVVHTEDATLVCAKDAADGLKALVKQIGAGANAMFT